MTNHTDERREIWARSMGFQSYEEAQQEEIEAASQAGATDPAEAIADVFRAFSEWVARNLAAYISAKHSTLSTEEVLTVHGGEFNEWLKASALP